MSGVALTEDAVLDGAVRLRQPARGYRAGLDAALLAAACAGLGGRVLDAGCGVGAAMLAAAMRAPQARFTGLEKDETFLALARENIAANGLSAACEALLGDVAQPFSRLGRPPFDAAIANPPYFDNPSALRAPGAEKRGAWLAVDGLSTWTTFLVKAVREGGVILLIHRAERLADLLGGLAPKAGSLQVRPIHPFADAPASRVLVRAVKTGRAPLKLLPPLILHPRGAEAHTPEAEAILRGQNGIGWVDQ